jgi:hypothetical protein
MLSSIFVKVCPTGAAGVDGAAVPGVDVPGVDVPGVDVPGVDVPGVDVPGVADVAKPAYFASSPLSARNTSHARTI